MEHAFGRFAEARRGWFGLDAVAHALRVALPDPCGLFDELGRAIWLNDAAEREVGLRAMKTATGVLLPARRPELAIWSDAVTAASQRSRNHEPVRGQGLTVRRIDRPELPSLFLVTAEASPAHCLRQLSAREREIAELSARGYSVLNVAQQLGIAEGTTRNHLKNIYRKLGVCTRVGLARAVWGLGEGSSVG
jgi:DNA-binding NarL/FixJ family response regulator